MIMIYDIESKKKERSNKPAYMSKSLSIMIETQQFWKKRMNACRTTSKLKRDYKNIGRKKRSDHQYPSA